MTERSDFPLSSDDEIVRVPDVLPVMPLKDAVLFPYTILPLAVGRDASLRAVEAAQGADRLILLVTQRDAAIDEPSPDQLYRVGCVALVMRVLKLPDGSVRVLVQGLARAQVDYWSRTEPYLEARLTRIEEPTLGEAALEVEARVREIRQGLERVSTAGRQISPEVMLIAAHLDDPLRLADLAASNLGLKVDDAQRILETGDGMARIDLVHELLLKELSLLEMQNEIASRVRGEMESSQREWFLRQQLKTIRQELGEADDLDREVTEYRHKVEALDVPDEVRKELDEQLRRLSTMHPDSAETSVLRTWLDWMTTLPWGVRSEETLGLAQAREILDADHYGLEKVKRRIIEFLAVRTLKPDGREPILCFVGPPGVGKTSLGRSIARALNRKFVRTSLGGVRDEAEIRGHRRTYVGALPGRIVQGLHQAGTCDPVFMLDEVDKVGADVRGDPSSALLEVLDPEQNNSFRDHYLGVPFDLSKVLFIATANVTDTIQPAFLDRMEVIELDGYGEEEKLEIARRHLVPRQLDANGLENAAIRFGDHAIELLIGGYTREAGLRNLEREIGAVCRKVAVEVVDGKKPRRRITPTTVETLLGPRRFLDEPPLEGDRIGVATGLAYTVVGGDILYVEAISLPGKADLRLTGSLGEVMKESASAALSLVRAHGEAWGIPAGWFDQHHIHVHVPAGGVPKDGPSAGVTLLAAVVSVAAGRPVRRDLAMTGEITLRGDVMAVGGVREKVLAALRHGISDVLLPADNQRDLADLPPAARRRLRPQFVRRVDDVLKAVLRPTT
jgi:ATP-dependent Lon protease